MSTRSKIKQIMYSYIDLSSCFHQNLLIVKFFGKLTKPLVKINPHWSKIVRNQYLPHIYQFHKWQFQKARCGNAFGNEIKRKYLAEGKIPRIFIRNLDLLHRSNESLEDTIPFWFTNFRKNLELKVLKDFCWDTKQNRCVVSSKYVLFRDSVFTEII